MEDWKEKLRNKTKEGIDNRQARGSGKRSVIDLSMINLPIWSPRSGSKEKNFIDIMPWRVTQSWYKKLLVRSGKATNLDPGYCDYKLEISRHSNVGPGKAHMLCLRESFGKSDPVCDDMFAEYQKRKDGDRSFDKEKARALQPSWRDFYIVVDYDDSSKGFQLWPDVSYELFEKFLLDELAKAEDGDGTIVPWDLENGRSIEWQGREEKFGNNPYIKLWGDITFHKRDSYTEADVAKLPSLDAALIIPTYEEIKSAHYGMDEEDGGGREQEEKQEATPPAQEPSRTRTRSVGTADQPPAASGPTTGRTREREKTSPSADECPAGGKFGVDCGKIQACKDEACDDAVYQSCLKRREELSKKEEETKKESEKPGAATSRTRRR